MLALSTGREGKNQDLRAEVPCRSPGVRLALSGPRMFRKPALHVDQGV